ncbi:MAG: hypothetical protein V3V09_02445 [Arenicellales bacterium]
MCRNRTRLVSASKVACLFFGLFIGQTTQAQTVSLDTLKTHWGATLGGILTTIAAHELGHFIVAEHEGADAYFDGITIEYRHTDQTNRQNLRLSSAGYQSQWLLSEYAFSQLNQPDLSANKQAWNTGLVLGHIGITVAYLSVLKNHEDGDALGVAQASGLSLDKVLLSLAIPAALDSWRLFGKRTPKWTSWASRGFKAVGISATWAL